LSVEPCTNEVITKLIINYSVIFLPIVADVLTGKLFWAFMRQLPDNLIIFFFATDPTLTITLASVLSSASFAVFAMIIQLVRCVIGFFADENIALADLVLLSEAH
jgi:hypothetical protein